MNVTAPEDKKFSPKDYASDQEVRWCPGCGDYAILKGVRKTLADLQSDPSRTVFVSGIGCAARFPYYMSTYGIHTIHGRAPAVATGVKLANPELDVWIVSGDGDALSIGGNHLMHVLRRNVDVNFLLFNNEIYGLTKGQYSPTSRLGTTSPSTPGGSVDAPVSAALLALGSGARFVARAVDHMQKHMPGVLARAHGHKGASFVEVFQNCKVYNDGVFDHFTEKAVASDAMIDCVAGQPLIFGKERNKGLVLDTRTLKIAAVTIGEGGVAEKDVLVHDETNQTMAVLLASMETPLPVAIGVIYCNPAVSYDEGVMNMIQRQKTEKGGDFNALLRKGHTWKVE